MKRSRFRHKLYDVRTPRPVDPIPDFKYEGCFPPNHSVRETQAVTQRPDTPKTGLWARFILWFKDQPVPSAPVRPVHRQYSAQGDQDPRP